MSTTPTHKPVSTGNPASGRRTVSTQRSIPGALLRGGTSRGPFFKAADLPTDIAERDRVLLAIMGSPHPLQIDGVGGGHPLTSKVGIVGPSAADGVDLDFTFAQLQPDAETVQTTANCGNMLSAVVPFAVESGMLEPVADETTAVVRTLNTGLLSQITISTPEVDSTGTRAVAYAGETSIDGVAGTGSAIAIRFVDTAGSIAGSMLPTGKTLDEIIFESGATIEATLIDNGQPLVMLRASDLGRTGDETVAELNADTELKEVVEEIRLKAGELMGLGDVSAKNYPKMTLVASPRNGGAVTTRSFIPHKAHESIGVLAALTVATAVCMDGSITAGMAAAGSGRERVLAIEHPGGEFRVDLQLSADGEVLSSGITRTARLLMSGELYY